MNTNRNTKSDKNMSGGNEIGDKNLQVLSSLKEKLQEGNKEENSDKKYVWLQKFGKNTVLTKMTDMSNQHLQNAYYNVLHKMEEHYKKMNLLEDLAQQIEEVAKSRKLTLKDIDVDYSVIRKNRNIESLKAKESVKK